MELSEIMKLLLIGLCIFSILLLIFYIRKVNFDTNVDEVLNLYRKELERSKKELEEGNKKINKIEKEISVYKRKLNMKLFDDNN